MFFEGMCSSNKNQFENPVVCYIGIFWIWNLDIYTVYF